MVESPGKYQPVEMDSATQEMIQKDANEESMRGVAIQVFFPFILAGLGMVTAGLVLDKVAEWEVFLRVPEIFILVPALLGLKGNLEMTFASRLSTYSSQGQLDSFATACPIITGQLSLTQVQGIVVGFLASCVATLMTLSTGEEVSFEHVILMCASAMLTASIASFILGLIMVGVIVASRRVGCNPDNVAAPIAAALGDLTTLALLSYNAQTLYNVEGSMLDLTVIGVLLLIVAPICGIFAARDVNSLQVLKEGWTPVLISMCISSAGGLILDKFMERFPRMAAFQPVMNGAGGNLVAVQASRIATHLHSYAHLGTLKEDDDSFRSCSPFSVFCSPSRHAMTAKVLMMLVVPGQLIFFLTIHFAAPDEQDAGFIFLSLYLSATLVQEWLLLYCCMHLVHLQWKKGIDPDSATVPYLTAFGDLVGTSLLTLVFVALSTIDSVAYAGVEDNEVEPLNMTEAEITHSLQNKFLLSPALSHGLSHKLRFR